MAKMSDPQRHNAAIADLIDGELHIKTLKGDYLIISLGPAQVISAKRGLDRYVANYEVQECKVKE